MKYLIFTASGTTSAWGKPLPGNTRKTNDHPNKSGITGFSGACLGIGYDMEKEYVQLAQMGFACREDVPGTLLMDFQTVQVGPGIVSERYYLVGAIFTVCLWKTDDSFYPLKKIAEAIIRPYYQPFLGRKNCPLNAPPNPKIISAENLSEAFKQYRPPEFLSPSLKGQKRNRIFWEGTDQSIPIIISNTRFDQPTSFRRYVSRIEHMGWEGVSNVSE